MNIHSTPSRPASGRQSRLRCLCLVLLLLLLPSPRTEASVKQACLECNLIITIDSSGRLVARKTVEQPPLSDSEHLIVGIENHWNIPIPSLYLHGNGIFDFPGENRDVPFQLQGAVDEPPGHVFGSGPRRSVDLNIFNGNEGEVIFTQGLKPGEDAWFVLRKKPGRISMMVHSVPDPSLLSLLSLGLIAIGVLRHPGSPPPDKTILPGDVNIRATQEAGQPRGGHPPPSSPPAGAGRGNGVRSQVVKCRPSQ